MDFLTSPMYDVSNIDMWKFKMSAYLKSLRLQVYIATTKKSYLGNDKYLEANTQVVEALRHTLSENYLFLILIVFRFCSVEHIDFSQETNDKHFEEEI